MPKQRVTIPLMPTSGLQNAGLQARISEQALWQADGAEVDLGGRLVKRRGLTQWGPTLKEPRSDGLRWAEQFNDLSHFDFPDGTSTANISQSISNSRLVLETTGTGAGTETLRVRRLPQSNDGTADSATEMSYRFYVRSRGALPANPGGGNDYGPSICIANSGGGATDSTNVAFFSDGLYTFNAGTFTIVAGTDIDDSRWHLIELRFTQGLLTIYVDDVLKATDVAVSRFAVAQAQPNQVTFKARLNASTKYAIEFDFCQARSSRTNPFTAVRVTNLLDWTSTYERHLLAVAGSTIYTDTGHTGAITGLASTMAQGLTSLVPFLDKLIILHPNLQPKQWSGTGVPIDIPSAPKLGFAVEHKARLFASGSVTKPLRVYFSGADNLEDWTTEEGGSFTTSGFFNIPDKRGSFITGLRGNFFGDLLVWTSSGSLWRVTGNFVDLVPPDYSLSNISTTVGAVGPRAIEQVSNDCFFQSARGVHTVATTDRTEGSMQEAFASAVISNRWQRDAQFDLARVRPHYEACIAHVPEEDRTYVGVQLEDDDHVNHAFVFNHDTKQWSGPIAIPGNCMAYVQLGYPELPCLMVGDSAGRIGYMTSEDKSDFGSGAYEYILTSAKLDGRSIDPGLSKALKNWTELRLFVVPRSDHNFTIGWGTDENPIRPEIESAKAHQAVVTQNQTGRPALTTSFVLEESRLGDSEQVVVITVVPDVVGRWFHFYVRQNDASADAVVVGAEIDFLVNRAVQENE